MKQLVNIHISLQRISFIMKVKNCFVPECDAMRKS